MADDRVQGTNGFKNGGRSSTRHKRLIKRTTIVNEAQTAVKTDEDRQRRTNACKTSDDRVQGTYGSKKRQSIVYEAQTA